MPKVTRRAGKGGGRGPGRVPRELLTRFDRVEARLDEIARELRARRLADEAAAAERALADPTRTPLEQVLTEIDR